MQYCFHHCPKHKPKALTGLLCCWMCSSALSTDTAAEVALFNVLIRNFKTRKIRQKLHHIWKKKKNRIPSRVSSSILKLRETLYKYTTRKRRLLVDLYKKKPLMNFYFSFSVVRVMELKINRMWSRKQDCGEQQGLLKVLEYSVSFVPQSLLFGF